MSGTRWRWGCTPPEAEAHCQHQLSNLSHQERQQHGRGALSSTPGPAPTVVRRHEKMGLNPRARNPNSSPFPMEAMLVHHESSACGNQAWEPSSSPAKRQSYGRLYWAHS